MGDPVRLVERKLFIADSLFAEFSVIRQPNFAGRVDGALPSGEPPGNAYGARNLDAFKPRPDT
jgi:hypothetical protein